MSMFTDLVNDIRDNIYPYIQNVYGFFTTNKPNIDTVAENIEGVNLNATNMPSILSVNANELNINILAAIEQTLKNLGLIKDQIVSLEGIGNEVVSLDGIKSVLINLDTIKTDITGLNAISNVLIALNSISPQISALDGIKATLLSLESIHDVLVSVEGIKSAISANYANEANINAVVANETNINTIVANITAIQNALSNAQASATSASEALAHKEAALGYRNEAEGFRNEAQIIAGGEVVSTNVKFSDLTDLETYRTNTDAALNALDLLLNSDNLSLDTLQEIVDFIELNRATLETLGISNIAGLQAALDAKSAELQAHANNTSNPHAVTKAQVGLSNVDNTSDMLKPVSTAQANALALKVAISSIVNVLTSTATNAPLSAAQGKVLKDALDGKAALKGTATIYGGAKFSLSGTTLTITTT